MPVTSPPAGPVEWVAITFPGSGLGPEVTAPLAGLVDTKTVRVLDAVVVRKAADGTIRKVHAKSIGENSVHGSDAPETAAIEIAQFFSGNEIVR